MDKDIEHVLLHQAEQRKQQLKDEINDLKQQINNMSEQNNPYVKAIDAKNDIPQVEYKTVFSEFIGQLDDEVTAALNDGWQPAGPQYKADVKFYQPMVRVPRQMMPQPR